MIYAILLQSSSCFSRMTRQTIIYISKRDFQSSGGQTALRLVDSYLTMAKYRPDGSLAILFHEASYECNAKQIANEEKPLLLP